MKKSNILKLVASFAAISSIAFANPTNKETTTKKSKNTVISAYEREYAFLMSEMEQITKRLGDQRKTTKDILADFKNKNADLRKKIELAKKEQKSLTKKVNNLEISKESLVNGEETLKNIYLSAGETFKDVKNETSKENLASQIDWSFSNVTRSLSESDAPVAAEAPYFDLKGNLKKGKVIRLGNFASFAVEDGKLIQLVPAGNESMKAVKVSELTADSAVALETFIYEGKKAVEQKKEKTIMDTLEAGGSIGVVILALGFVSLILLILRFFNIRSASKDFDTLTENVKSAIAKNDISGIKSTLKSSTSSLSKVLYVSVDSLGKDREIMETKVSEVLLSEGNKLNKYSTIIIVTAAVAPLLGLLGTVTGMIATFDIITEVGTGDPKMLSGGISEALVTTMLGLVVAIPTLFFGQIIGKWADKARDVFEEASLSVVAAHDSLFSSKDA